MKTKTQDEISNIIILNNPKINKMLREAIKETESKCNKDFNEFVEKLKKECDNQDLDIMVTDGDDGDITISLSEFIDKLIKGDDNGK